MKITSVVFSLFFFIGTLLGQREINSSLISSSIELNGSFDEVVWKSANWETGFTQMRPFPGEKASQKT